MGRLICWAMGALLFCVPLTAAEPWFSHDEYAEAEDLAKRTGRLLAWLEVPDRDAAETALVMGAELSALTSLRQCVKIKIVVNQAEPEVSKRFQNAVASLPVPIEEYLPRLIIADLEGRGLIGFTAQDQGSAEQANGKIDFTVEQWGGVPSMGELQRFWSTLRKVEEQFGQQTATCGS